MRSDWHINRTYTMADMDAIQQRVDDGWQAEDLAHYLSQPMTAVMGLLQRNGVVVRPRQKRK